RSPNRSRAEEHSCLKNPSAKGLAFLPWAILWTPDIPAENNQRKFVMINRITFRFRNGKRGIQNASLKQELQQDARSPYSTNSNGQPTNPPSINQTRSIPSAFRILCASYPLMLTLQKARMSLSRGSCETFSRSAPSGI